MSSVCGGQEARWLREALPAGWGDTYYQSVAGQAFNITNLPNGRYKIRVTINPLGLLKETNANNVEDRYFVLKGLQGPPLDRGRAVARLHPLAAKLRSWPTSPRS